MTQKRIRVLVVDDSALVRKIVTASLAPFPDIEVVGTAPDPYLARDRILELEPDVLTLDIEMPRMDGLTFLRVIMKHRPMPIIILSSLTQAGSEKALEALQAGAVDVLSKPSNAFSANEDGLQLAEKIRAAAGARLRPAGNDAPLAAPVAPRAAGALRGGPAAGDRHLPARRIILLGASTGGTEALKDVLTTMSGDLPGICIVQHIPAYFSKAFADRLNQCCAMEVREARQGDVVQRGLALVAPGGYHMILKWNSVHYTVDLSQGPQIHHQRPAVDILFDSAVKCGAGPYATAAVLTGMGADGAAGLLRLRQAGASTIAQNEESCVVFGMPREAIRLGAAQHVVPLEYIGRRLEHLALHSPSGTAAAA
jgi:two-component system, chemotaxis family, protein-glutamate methylesterase/glutaminase